MEGDYRYKEYPIRCKTCNEQIACYAESYEEYLRNGLSIKEALDALGIINYCTRNNMMHPTIVPLNMENREIIEGRKAIDVLDEPGGVPSANSSKTFGQACTPGLTPGVAQLTR